MQGLELTHNVSIYLAKLSPLSYFTLRGKPCVKNRLSNLGITDEAAGDLTISMIGVLQQATVTASKYSLLGNRPEKFICSPFFHWPSGRHVCVKRLFDS